MGAPKSFTDDEVRKIFSDNGCKLLSSHYESKNQSLEYIATCGHKRHIKIDNFVRGFGRFCDECNPKRKFLTLDTVRKIYQDAGCKLISQDYINTSAPLTYICQCGHEHTMPFYCFMRGQGRLCPACAGSKKKTIAEVRKRFSDEGCTLLSTEYKWNRQKVEYIARCGHRHTIKASAFFEGEGRLCPKCQGKENAVNSRTFRNEEDLKRYFAQFGCKYIDGGETIDDYVRYIAQCGHENIIRMIYFIKGRGRECKKCCRKVVSRGEVITRQVLESHRINYEVQKKISTKGYWKQSFDFYLPDVKIAIEYNGSQHYKENTFFHKCTNNTFEQQIMRDNRKREWCLKNDVKLIEIDGSKWTEKEMNDGSLYAFIEGSLINLGVIDSQMTLNLGQGDFGWKQFDA